MAGVPGFDCSGFPGLEVTSWLRSHTNLRWCGFYLGPAPSHPGHDWMPHRQALANQAWGLAPLYVGQQTIPPGSRHSSQAQGIVDGHHASALMTAAGFAPGHYVYLDLENGLPFTGAQREYVGAWVDTVAAGGFNAGVYCSHTFADQVHALRPAARVWTFKVPTTTAHAVPGTNFPDSHPAGSGFTGAFVWQLAQNAIIGSKPPATLKIDLDTALTDDPGRP